MSLGKNVIFSSEEKRDTPQGGESDQGIYYSGDYCRLTAEDPSDYIKTEYSKASPVQSADNE